MAYVGLILVADEVFSCFYDVTCCFGNKPRTGCINYWQVDLFDPDKNQNTIYIDK